ncbi:MAG TPA: iron ABC transporter permease [Candidatus Sulfotelmatobacter sp.]|nr:iron ABC transporter permease [Candidatus Sulfotelmatobacter sp.]
MTLALRRAESAAVPRRIDISMPLLAGFALFLCVLIGLPVFWLAVYAVTDAHGMPTLANFKRLVTDPDLLDPLTVTMILATSVGAMCCAVAAPMGWIVARTDMRGRGVVRALVTASFVTPPFLGAVAWEILAAPNSGILNQLYRDLFDLSPDDVLFNVYTLPGLAFVIACYTFPYVFVLVTNALERIPGDLEDASAILGAKTVQTARRITVPLVMPAILAGALIAFLQAMTLFGSPAILAMPAGFHTLTTKIFMLFQFPPKPGLAAAASLPLLVITVLLLRAQSWILGRRGYTVVGGKASDPRRIRLGIWQVPAQLLCFGVLCAPVFLPYAALAKAAFSQTPYGPLHWKALTLDQVRAAFSYSATQLALENTFLLCGLTATLGTILALVISYAVARQAIWGHRALGFLATAPVAIPGIVLGVGLFLAYTRPPLVLYGTLTILLLAYLTLQLPSAYQQLRAAFHGIHPELEEASRILGATRLQALCHVTAPLLRSGLIATWCFIFIGTMRELSAAIMLVTADTKVLSTVIYDLNEGGDLGQIAVLGLTMLVVTFGVVSLANRLPGFGVARG